MQTSLARPLIYNLTLMNYRNKELINQLYKDNELRHIFNNTPCSLIIKIEKFLYPHVPTRFITIFDSPWQKYDSKLSTPYNNIYTIYKNILFIILHFSGFTRSLPVIHTIFIKIPFAPAVLLPQNVSCT